MTELESEIRSYNILLSVKVRGSGSTRGTLQNRCLWDICGKPALEWILLAAKDSKYLNKIVVITESEQIKEMVKSLNGIALIDRPLWTSKQLPRDFTQGTFKRGRPRSILSEEALIYNHPETYSGYFLEQTEGYKTDIMINVNATAPLITSEIIDRMIETFFQNETLAIVIPLYPILPYIRFINQKSNRPVQLIVEWTERQEALQLYNSASFGLRGRASKAVNTPVEGQAGYIVITEEEGLDMHDEEGLFKARCSMKKRLLKEGEKVEWSIGDD